MRLFLLLVMLGAVLAAPARALTEESATSTVLTQMSDDQDKPGSFYFFASQIDKYIDHPKNTLDWHLLAKTKEINQEGKTPDGLDYQYFKPGFPGEVKALDGKQVTIKGFMFPLDENDKQGLFLLGPFPLSCPFQYHVGPSLVIEVHADKKPVKFTYDPITVTGTLELVPKDMENSTFYRLMDSREVK